MDPLLIECSHSFGLYYHLSLFFCVYYFKYEQFVFFALNAIESVLEFLCINFNHVILPKFVSIYFFSTVFGWTS